MQQTPPLMHGILTLAATHERYFSATPAARKAPFRLHHWAQCAGLFKRRLERPLRADEHDPLYATATVMSIISFASVDSFAVEETWPLADGPADLQWLRMNEGKTALWFVTDPFRSSGNFHLIYEEYMSLIEPLPQRGCAGIDPRMVALCGLGPASTPRNNPYFAMAHVVGSLQRQKTNIHNCQYLTFIIFMQQKYRDLVTAKDPVALLILAQWYEMARNGVWWIKMRAEVEFLSVCLYLERYHGDNEAIQELLPSIHDPPACQYEIGYNIVPS
jgi:hypothetical protein